jgi:2-polyprenyl-3-methyl-5-hydroxy-6-metoxy-1,4-benzoquinol methylase
MRFEIVQSHRPDPLGGGREARVVAETDRHGEPLRNVCWVSSGFIGVDPLPMADVEGFYKREYRQEYKGSVSPQGRHVLRAARVAKDRLRRIAEAYPGLHQRRLRALDAGASSGEFVFLMSKLGHLARGIEAHQGYAEYASSRLGLDIANVAFSEFEGSGEPFDVITMFHVLEHLEFPVRELERLAAMLHPEGVFVIEVPNILYRRMRFCHKWHRGHLSGFSARTLEATALRAGLVSLVCGEVGDGGNLFGVFRRGTPLCFEEIQRRWAGEPPEMQALGLNTDLDYFSSASTWSKVFPKFFSQIEERWTASRFGSGLEILEAVHEGRG